MLAVILASGVGSRLMPLTEDIPKCLVKVGPATLLDMELDSILYCGIKKIIITTGYMASEVEAHVKQRYPDLDIIFVENERYGSTNYIYSMWLTKDFIDDDVLLLHGDTLFDKELLGRMLNEKAGNAVLVNKQAVSGKDFKAAIVEEMVEKIGVDLSGDNAYFCAPIYKLKKAAFERWLQEIGLFIEDGDDGRYAEDAFNRISAEIGLTPVYYTDEFCMEVDTLEDLRTAEQYYKNGRI